ncbi:MAG TPA: hypothetical protein PLF26_09850, partial [Blastocatellia bacterium]|nr:hypothetical protein [Blastocatellia bacterium]
PSDAPNVMLTSATPANATFSSATAPAGWACVTPPPLTTGSIVCSTPGLAAGASATITIVVRVDALLPSGTLIDYSVAATSDASDPSPADNTAGVTIPTTAPPSADIQLAGTVSAPTTAPGGTLVFTLTATNAGPDTVASLTITDPLPTGTTFVSVAPDTDGTATAPAVGETGVVTTNWASPTLPGESRTTTIVVQVDTNAADGFIITNVATATSPLSDPDGSNNSSTVSTVVQIEATQAFADLAVGIGELPPTVDTGTLLEYDITVTNNGPDASELVRLTGSTPGGTRFVSLTSDQGTVTAPAAGSTGSFACDIGTLEDGQSVHITLTVNVIAEGGATVNARFVASGSATDSLPFNNSAATITGVRAGNDTLLTWDPPLECSDDCLNPPLHLQTSAPPPGSASKVPRVAQLVAGVLPVARDPRNSLVGYNIYRSNSPNVTATPQNFFTSVPPSTTGIIAPTATTGSFFTVTAMYPNGESSDTNAASGGIPEPDIMAFDIRTAKVIVGGTGFSDTVQVFVDGIPFKKGARVKPGNVRIVQKGKLLTGQTVQQYLAQQGGVVLVSVLNADTGIGTFLYRSSKAAADKRE